MSATRCTKTQADTKRDGAWQGIANNGDIASGSLTPGGNPSSLITNGNSLFLATGGFHRVGRNLDVSEGGGLQLNAPPFALGTAPPGLMAGVALRE